MQIEFDREKLLQFFFAIKEQTGEGMLRISKEGLWFYSADVANVGFIDAKFLQPTSGQFDVAIDVQKFYSTLNALKTKVITIDFDKVCHFKGGKIERDVLTLTEASLSKQKEPPNLTFPVSVEVSSADYIDILESIDKMGAEEGALPLKVYLEYDKKKFIIYSVNELREKTRSEFDMVSVEKASDIVHKSGFAFDYLLKVAKIIKKTKIDNIKISIGTNYPCRFDLANEFIQLAWLVAPRIEDD